MPSEPEDLAIMKAMFEQHRGLASQSAPCMSSDELLSMLAFLNQQRPRELPGEQIDLRYCLDQETRDIYIAEFLARGNRK
jgi:hypothetical protein